VIAAFRKVSHDCRLLLWETESLMLSTTISVCPVPAGTEQNAAGYQVSEKATPPACPVMV
jgi:hypothetical protein